MRNFILKKALRCFIDIESFRFSSSGARASSSLARIGEYKVRSLFRSSLEKKNVTSAERYLLELLELKYVNNHHYKSLLASSESADQSHALLERMKIHNFPVQADCFATVAEQFMIEGRRWEAIAVTAEYLSFSATSDEGIEKLENVLCLSFHELSQKRMKKLKFLVGENERGGRRRKISNLVVYSQIAAARRLVETLIDCGEAMEEHCMFAFERCCNSPYDVRLLLDRIRSCSSKKRSKLLSSKVQKIYFEHLLISGNKIDAFSFAQKEIPSLIDSISPKKIRKNADSTYRKTYKPSELNSTRLGRGF
eukprot:g3814.t1